MTDPRRDVAERRPSEEWPEIINAALRWVDGDSDDDELVGDILALLRSEGPEPEWQECCSAPIPADGAALHFEGCPKMCGTPSEYPPRQTATGSDNSENIPPIGTPSDSLAGEPEPHGCSVVPRDGDLYCAVHDRDLNECDRRLEASQPAEETPDA